MSSSTIYVNTYIHTDRQKDRQTDIHTYIHENMYIHTHERLSTLLASGQVMGALQGSSQYLSVGYRMTLARLTVALRAVKLVKLSGYNQASG